jgi:subtilase family serine protease
LHTRAAPAPDYTAGGAHYLAAVDFQTIYNLKPLYAGGINGSGKSIAILGRSNVVVSDIQQFRTTMNLPANTPQIIINGSDPGLVAGDQGESDLDLEWAGAVAPAATIKFITSASTSSTDGIDLSAQYAVSNNVADVISLSYGQCESSLGTTALNYINNLWQQAAALGITVLVSSGDSGAAGCDAASASSATQGRAVNGLCSSPYSTCVGGTQFSDTANPSLYWSSTTNPTDQSSALSYIPEVVWNESAANGGTGLWSTGGGASIRFAKPSWQTTPGVPADGKRDVPDVALTASSHDGYLVYSSDNSTQTQTLYVFGGTSASAPAFAGILALVNQKTGYRQGNANPTLYGLASRQASNGTPAYFHTVTSGNNSVPGVTGFTASTSTPYFNQATGLGSVDVAVLVNHWTDLLPASSTALTVSPNPGTSGQNVTFTATVTGVAPTGTVQFADGATKLGSPVSLNGGVAALATSTLAPGNHSMTATYSGDSGNQPSISSPSVLAVMGTTTVALSAAPTSTAAGQSITFTATVSGTTPTGSVQFTDGGTNLGTPVVLSGGVATLTTATLSIGTHNIAAIYSGDTYNLGSTSPGFALTVGSGVAGAGDGDVPTLPEWAALLLGLMLMLTVWQRPLARR